MGRQVGIHNAANMQAEERRRGHLSFPRGNAYCRFMAFPINERKGEDEVGGDIKNNPRLF